MAQQLLLFRFDDALDRHVLVGDSAPLIALLESDLADFEEARSLAGLLVGSATARSSPQVSAMLRELRKHISAQLEPIEIGEQPR